MYNDIGGTPEGAGTYPASNIGSSSMTNADQQPIRLSNNHAVTGLPDNANTNLLDSGNCPYAVGTGTGSPVCVDTATTNVINSTTSNCDTYWLDYSAGKACPLYQDYYTFMNAR